MIGIDPLHYAQELYNEYKQEILNVKIKQFKHLQKSPLTPLDALMKYGCFRLSARINELRQIGYHIETIYKTDFETKKHLLNIVWVEIMLDKSVFEKFDLLPMSYSKLNSFHNFPLSIYY